MTAQLLCGGRPGDEPSKDTDKGNGKEGKDGTQHCWECIAPEPPFQPLAAGVLWREAA
jgi:hypothetical protein